DLLSFGLATSGQILATLGLTVIYCFFFLLDSTAFNRFLLSQFDRGEQGEGMQIMRNIQAVATNYLSGMLTVMLILGVLNSLGLYLIGIKYALVWGFLGALLAVIPYVGTTIGSLLPFLYAIATTDTFWQPAAVIVLYASVQFIEGNLITPKIVGNSVKINALAAVVSLVIGALLWGIAGVVIAIPLLAMTRIILDQIPPFKSFSLLLSDDLYAESGKFLGELNRPEYRLSRLFARRAIVIQPEEIKLTTAHPGDEVGQADAEVITDAETK
ncbi:MAG: AI-2E family transporter, partial [Bacteroidota bacterium]